MTNRTIAAVIVLLAILGLVFWWQQYKSEPQKEAINSVSAFNETKNQEGSQASPGDSVVYTLTVENPNSKVLTGYVVEGNISDISELANLVDAEGANYNPAAGSLIWTPLDIQGKSTIAKKVKVQIKSDLPNNSDLVMRMKFGNEVAVAVIRLQPQVAGETGGAGADPDFYVSPNSGLPLSIILLLSAVLTLGISLFRLARRMG